MAPVAGAVQPDTWETVIAYQLRPVEKEITASADKHQMNLLLDKLEAAAFAAKDANKYLSFIGD